MTRRLLISIAQGFAELAWDRLRKAPGKAWAVAHAWLVVRAGERERACRPVHMATPEGDTWCGAAGNLSGVSSYWRKLPNRCPACVEAIERGHPAGERAVTLDAEEQAMVDGWEREPPVNAKGDRS